MNVLRRKPDPAKVSWKDIKALKEDTMREGNYALFKDCCVALRIGFRNNEFYDRCEFVVLRRRLRETSGR